MKENDKIEFKEELNDKLEKEIVAFLNSNCGGSVYIGVKDNGEIKGVEDIDKTMLEIQNRIRDRIAPSSLGLYEIIELRENNKKYIQIAVSSGDKKPYYLKSKGMCPEGCYIRVGTASEKMNEDMIYTLFEKRKKVTLITLVSPKQDLTFKELEIYYKNAGYDVGKNFLKQLSFYNQNNEFNYLAYLFSDNNDVSIQIAKYKDDTIYDLEERIQVGKQSLLRVADEVLNKFKKENTIYTRITDSKREEVKKFDEIALREIIVNALVHNDYSKGAYPSFEIFENHIEVSSFGGLPQNLTEEDFFEGFSLPVNPELIRIFHDIGFVERLGTGIRRVLRVYPKEIFKFSPNFIRVSIPFNKGLFGKENSSLKDKILNILNENPKINRKQLGEILDVSESTIYREINKLQKERKIERIGSNKDGYWKVK